MGNLLIDSGMLLVGFLLAVIGGDFFVKSVVSIAYFLRISPAIVAVTVAAFATSSPELSVAINSAMAGEPAISLGNALGSNVVNVAVILGVVLLIGQIQTTSSTLKRDFPFALIVPVILGVMSIDGSISRIDAILMLFLFLTWLTFTVMEAKRQRLTLTEEEANNSITKTLIFGITGLVCLFLSGSFIVSGAEGIALHFGVDPFLIGATIVSIGTTTPEMAVTIIAVRKGHDEVGLGTVLGSNIFNGLFIVSVAALITPIQISSAEVLVAVIFGILSIGLVLPTRNFTLGRRRGATLVIVYAIYLATIIQQG